MTSKYVCIAEFSLFPALSRTFDSYEEAESFCIGVKKDGFRCRMGLIANVPEYNDSFPDPSD